ncbi:Protein SFI1, partial [Tinamus guttatus]
RLQELRLRYLTRKFFYVWAKKTFGQVLPSKIRWYCDQKILQKSSGEWKEEWWIACREKKLIFRADCHYRYFLYQLVLKAWRAFICQQQEKRSKNHVAEVHANKQKLRWTWLRWLIYVDIRRTKHSMQAVALAFRERSCLRVSWAVWRRRRYQNCAGRKMKVLALQHWAQSLQFRAWLQWRALYLYSQNEKQKEARAVTHHRHWQLKTSIETWLRYLNLQRTKRCQKELAQEHHQRRIVQQYFSGWQLSWESRRRMRTRQKCIEKLAAKIVLGRVFASWKHYVVLRVEKAWRRELAEKHHRHHLLVLQNFWNRWKSRLEEKEEEQEQTLTSVAQTRYRGKEALIMGVANLILFIKEDFGRIHSSLMSGGSAPFYYLLSYWSFEVRKINLLSEGIISCADISLFACREVLMRKVFDMWWLRARKQQEYRMEEKRAVLHFERQLLVSFWCFWRRRTNEVLEEQEDLLCARNHYSYVLLFKAFCLWKQNTQERKTERLKEMQAVQFHCSKCLQQSWIKWREYVGHQCEKWKKLVRADIHYQHTLLGKALAAWKSYQHNVRCILNQVSEKEKQRCRLLLQQLLHIWRENALEAKAACRADQHYRRVILSKVLLQWRCVASLQAHYRQQKLAAVKEGMKHLNIAHLQSLFLHWKEVAVESLMLRAKQDRAVQHHQQHLLQKYLGTWKKYHQQYTAKALLQRQGYQLMTRRLCSDCFSCWKKQLVQRQWEKRETVRALWHWCLSLQGKVFGAWLGFVQEQQWKEKLPERAGVVHCAALQQEGVTGIVRHSAGVEQLRRQLQAQHQPKAAYSLHQSVHRCAMLWKEKALCKQLNKTSTPLLLPKKQVTFKVPDVNPGTRGCSAEEVPWPSESRCSPFLLAAGDSILSELNVLRQARLPPRRPDFLLESLESKELLGMAFTRSETPSQRTVVNKCSAHVEHLVLSTQTEGSICNQLSQVGSTAHAHPSSVPAALPSAPAWPDDEHHTVQLCPRPELWPPSSFIPQMKAEAKKVSVLYIPVCKTHSGKPFEKEIMSFEAHSQDSQQGSGGKKLQPNLQPHLLSPEDFMGKQCHQTTVLLIPFIRSCQEQAQILQKWLETSTQPEDQDAIQQVQEELHQLEMRVKTLTKAQLKERHHVQKLVARLHDIHSALEL